MTGSSLTDDVFQALSDPLRREILCLLDSTGDEVIEREYISEIISILYDTPEERAATALDHNHLPKLESAGLVDFDMRSGAIRYDGKELVSVLRENDLIECKICSDEYKIPDIKRGESSQR